MPLLCSRTMNDAATIAAADVHHGNSPPPPCAKIRWPRQRHLLAGPLLLLLAAGGAAWWIANRSAAMHYTTAPVTRGAVARAVTATGTVNPVLTIMVGSYVSGVIQELHCDYNTQVKKGQLCAKIDPRPYQTIVDQDKANLAAAKAQLEKDQANLAYAKVNYERNRLAGEQNSIAAGHRRQSKSVYDRPRPRSSSTRQRSSSAQAALDGAQVNLGYTNIVSPVDGTVVSRNVTMGQTVAASFQTPTLFLIATDLTKMQVDTNVSESDIGGVKVGNPGELHRRGLSRSRRSTAASTRCARRRRRVQNVVTYDVVVGVANPDLLLKPGMTATIRIITAQRDNVLRVPDQALRYMPAAAAVSAAASRTAGASGAAAADDAGPAGTGLGPANGKPVRVAVTLGLDDDSYTEIVGGELKAGDQVIVSEQRRRQRQSRPSRCRGCSATATANARRGHPDRRRHADLSCRRHRRARARGVELTVERGEFVAIMGSSARANRR